MKRILVISVLVGLAFCGCDSSVAQSTNSVLLGDEVMLHVVNECDLYRTYQRNRIDFDPIEVGSSILPEMRRNRNDWLFLRNSIRDTVQYEESFYRRALMYNAYYQLCIQRIGTSEAERSMLGIRALSVDPSITEADATIRSLFDTFNDASRVRRDRAKIEVLRFIEASEPDPVIQRKIQSVIQEIVYDIELWSSRSPASCRSACRRMRMSYL